MTIGFKRCRWAGRTRPGIMLRLTARGGHAIIRETSPTLAPPISKENVALSELSDLCTQMLTCTACGLSQGRTRVVPGEGPEDAEIMFIGEAPGQQEDRQGRPFVGPAGQLLNELLGHAGLRREDVYICNVVKCRPPNNRDPLPTEIQTCKPWLDAQIKSIKPRIIVTLGRYSMARWFPGQSISKIHGRHIERDGVVIFPMFHPAAALHQQNLRAFLEADMKRLRTLLEELRTADQRTEAAQQPALLTATAPVRPGPPPPPSAAAPSEEPNATQLSLF